MQIADSHSVTSDEKPRRRRRRQYEIGRRKVRENYYRWSATRDSAEATAQEMAVLAAAQRNSDGTYAAIDFLKYSHGRLSRRTRTYLARWSLRLLQEPFLMSVVWATHARDLQVAICRAVALESLDPVLVEYLQASWAATDVQATPALAPAYEISAEDLAKLQQAIAPEVESAESSSRIVDNITIEESTPQPVDSDPILAHGFSKPPPVETTNLSDVTQHWIYVYHVHDITLRPVRRRRKFRKNA